MERGAVLANSKTHMIFGQAFVSTRLPPALDAFALSHLEQLWDLHPATLHSIRQPYTGRIIPLPRWQQAYGRDYRYTGSVNVALPIPPILEPFLTFARR